MEFYLLLFVTGLVGGLISGLLGVGGGLIYVLALPIAFNFLGVPNQEIAQFTIANSLLGTFFAASFATYNHIKNKEIYVKPILLIGIAGIISGLLTFVFIVNTTFYAQKEFNIVIICLMLVMLFTTLRNARRQVGFVEETTKIKRTLTLTGVFSGSVAALSGLGGGIVIIPFLNQVLKFNIRKAKAISLGVIMITSFCMILYNAFQSPVNNLPIGNTGYLVFKVSLPIILGALTSASLGVKLSRKMSVSTISYLFSGFVLIVMIRKILELL